MATNAQKRQQQKKAKRKKRLAKERNMRSNGARMRYTLECRMGKDEPWKPMKRFRDAKEVQKHLDETEAIRKRGDTEIIEGRVLDHNQLDRVVATVKPYVPVEGISLEDAAKNIERAAREQSLEGVKGWQKPTPINKNFEHPVGKAELDTVSECEEQHEPESEAANAEIS
jgi:hypothetical protein